MTAEKLLEVFEAYYGEKYGGIFKKLVLEYLAGMSPDFYRTCAGVVIRRFPRSFGKWPGIAEIEAHMGGNSGHHAAQVRVRIAGRIA